MSMQRKMMLSISEPECGGKPTGFLVEIPNNNRATLREAIVKGLMRGWSYVELMAESLITEDDLDTLKASDYVYLDGVRFLVEVTIVDDVEIGSHV